MGWREKKRKISVYIDIGKAEKCLALYQERINRSLPGPDYKVSISKIVDAGISMLLEKLEGENCGSEQPVTSKTEDS